MGIVEVFSCVCHFPCLYKVGVVSDLKRLLGGTSPFIKPAFPKMAALVIRNRIVLWFHQDLDLFQRSLAYKDTVPHQRLCL